MVDDERINRMVVSRILNDCYAVSEAGDGAEALALVEAGSVDLVVLDIHMPGMDGIETMRRMKATRAGRFLPVILMTATNDEALFARGLTDGADAFITKPISRALLRGKIVALLRVADLLGELRDSNDELNSWRGRAEQDFAIANHLFQHIAERSRFDFPDLHVRALSLEAFNGDIVLAAPMANGRLRILVGDFAGHGLGAALGALPVSDAFYAMTRRQFPIEALVREIGGKLHHLFPRNRFLAACIADIDPREESALIWNGGLPAPVVVDAGGRIIGRAPSLELALGVLPGQDLRPRVARLSLPIGSRFILFTDGLIEAMSPNGVSFDEERLETQLTALAGRDDWFASLGAAFDTFRRGTTQHDDVTMVGLQLSKELRAALTARAPEDTCAATPAQDRP